LLRRAPLPDHCLRTHRLFFRGLRLDQHRPFSASSTSTKQRLRQSPHATNPNADYIAPSPSARLDRSSASRRSSVTPVPPHEPPPDRFTASPTDDPLLPSGPPRRARPARKSSITYSRDILALLVPPSQPFASAPTLSRAGSDSSLVSAASFETAAEIPLSLSAPAPAFLGSEHAP